MSRTIQIKRHRGGWLMLEMITALFVLTLLAGVMIVTANQQRRALDALSGTRASVRVAEAVLSDMQGGKRAPVGQEGVQVKQLDRPAEPATSVWVEIDVTLSGRSATLVGLVPRAAVGGGHSS